MGSHENTGNQSVDRKKILQREWKHKEKKTYSFRYSTKSI